MPDAPNPRSSSFHQAAKGSWVAPIVGAFAGNFARRSSPGLADLLTMSFVLLGLGLGVVSLFGMLRVGRRGILGQAIIGLLICLGLFAIFISNVIGSMK